jgi:hypothetical protein
MASLIIPQPMRMLAQMASVQKIMIPMNFLLSHGGTRPAVAHP